MKTSHRSPEQGSALMYSLIVMTILLAISASVLRPVSDEFVNTYHTASWQEALLAAESGIDLAALQLRQNLSQPDGTWPSSWSQQADGSYVTSQTYQHQGEGGFQQTVKVTVDAPPTLRDPLSGWQYYRVRSTGTISFSGSRRAAGDKRDLELRKLSLVRDRTTHGIAYSPSVSRTVEVVMRPSSAFPVALLSKETTTITSQNVVVDSYDSSDPLKSTNGQWDPSKRQQHGDVATDGNLIAAGNARIYGNVSTNGGTVTGINNITGAIRDDFWQDIPSVITPTWTNPTPGVVNGTTTLTGSSVKGGARYKLTGITLSGNDVLTLQTPTGAGPSYLDLYVDGDISVLGNAQILVAKGLTVTVYVKGDMNIGGNGLGNASTSNSNYERPANVSLFSIQPTAGVTQNVKLNGNADLQAAVYAPDSDVTIVGGGSNGYFAGSVVGKTIFMNGVTQVHYDEALARNGKILGYRIASWFEDNR